LAAGRAVIVTVGVPALGAAPRSSGFAAGSGNASRSAVPAYESGTPLDHSIVARRAPSKAMAGLISP
jgi:hypothetical protein